MLIFLTKFVNISKIMLTDILTIKFNNIPIITVVSENFEVYNVRPNSKTLLKKSDTMVHSVRYSLDTHGCFGNSGESA